MLKQTAFATIAILATAMISVTLVYSMAIQSAHAICTKAGLPNCASTSTFTITSTRGHKDCGRNICQAAISNSCTGTITCVSGVGGIPRDAVVNHNTNPLTVAHNGQNTVTSPP